MRHRTALAGALVLASALASPLAAQDAAQLREQIREQVRRDVEQARQEAQRARMDAADAAREARQAAQQAGQEGGPRIVIPPVPPIPPIPNGPVVFTGTGQPFPPGLHDIPPGVQETAMAFFFTVAAIFIGTPLARAFGRRLDRRPAAAAAAATSPDTVARLERIEQAVDAVALEVERISEGQRFVTKLMSDVRGLPAPDPAAANEVRMAERAPERAR